MNREIPKVGDSIPLPPYEYRILVGPTEPEAFDNPEGKLIFEGIAPHYYQKFFDFGCGCGRVARQLAQQTSPPARYLGIDLHKGMIEWCQQNITPVMPQFEFEHHDVFYIGFNPTSKKGKTDRFPAKKGEFSFVLAISVFTHLEQKSAEFYLKETARIMASDSVFVSSWFLFDKVFFPMMHTSQNALYVNPDDPANAVIFDQGWVREEAQKNGLKIVTVVPPPVRGGQWTLVMKQWDDPTPEVAFVEDLAPFGRYYDAHKEHEINSRNYETFVQRVRVYLRPVKRFVKKIINR